MKVQKYLENNLTIELREVTCQHMFILYPPKASYNYFTDGQVIKDCWSSVNGKINLYFHIPYCNMKCKFCNLYTTTDYSIETMDEYVDTILENLI